MLDARPVAGIRGALLESPVWDARGQALWWADIYGPTLNRWEPASGARASWTMPDAIGSFALAERGVLVALRHGVHLFDPATGGVRLVATADYDPADTRFNDGRCDRAGRFWVGTMHEPRTRKDAAWYRLDGGPQLTKVIPDLRIANSLAFSPDNRIAYLSDTPQGQVWAFDHDPATGALAHRRVFHQFGAGEGRPDGACIDAEGCYWIAAIDAYRVLRFTPDGRLDRVVKVPTRWPTMPCFGGPDLTTLYITSLRRQRPADQLATDPHAGGLFVVETDVKGLEEPRWAG